MHGFVDPNATPAAKVRHEGLSVRVKAARAPVFYKNSSEKRGVSTMVTTVQHELQSQELALARFETPAAKIGVVGLGYVGLPAGTFYSARGISITGFV